MRGHPAVALLAALAGLMVAASPLVAAPPPPAPAAPPVHAAQPPTGTTPFQTPDTSSCPNRLAPPAPVDLSEAPAAGQQVPAQLTVRSRPVGGKRMAECGLVLPGGAPPLPEGLSAHAWLIADLDSGAVLAARDPHGRHRPASTIKILTALVAIRELDLDREVIGTEEDANQEGTRVGLGPNGHYTVGQLLHALVMRSGNDAAHALAVQLGGVPAAVQKMDGLANELGALDTRVATPSGLDGPGTSVSAYDLGLIFRVAMRERSFAAALGTALVDFPGFQDKPGFKLANDNRLLASYPGALGGKTGFTDDARHTFVGAAQRGGRRLLVVLLRGEQLPVPMWEQAARLLDYGFALPSGSEPVGVLVDNAPPAEASGGAPRVGAAAVGTPEVATSTAQTASTAPAAPRAGAVAGGHGRLIYLAALLVLAGLLFAAVWWPRVRPVRR